MAERVGREGEQLGSYRLLSLLGRGGFAEVYLGEHIYLDSLAAIKVLHTRLASEDVEHFKAEARTVARLVHPHIVRVLEFNVEDLVPYLVTDYAPNGTLRQRHTRGVQLTLPTLVSYVMQVASALQYAHEQKVIHRDVKPENMLIGRHNEILLSDFGIALVAQSSRYEGAQGMQELAGTIAYMAPEQIHGQQAAPTPSANQGRTLYTFQGHMGWVWSAAWSPVAARVASGSSDNTAQVWDATFGDHFYTYPGHSSWVWTVAWSPDGKHIAAAGDNKVVQVLNAADGAHLFTCSGHTGFIYAVAWSRDSKHLASARDDHTVRIWDGVDGHRVFTYSGHTGSVRSVSWSPDNSSLASGSWDETVQVWRGG